MLIFQDVLKIISKEIGFLGWTITNSQDFLNRDELLIYPKYESDYRPIDENDSINRKDGIRFYSLDEILKELEKYKNFSVDYMGRINVLVCSYTDSVDYPSYLAEKENINRKIMKILREENIELSYDTKTVYVKN